MPTPDSFRLSVLCRLSFLLATGRLLPHRRPPAAAKPDPRPTGLYLAVFSDPHYFDPQLLVRPGKAFNDYLKKDRKLIAQSHHLTRAVVEAIKASPARLVLVPGDLTKDGEKSSHHRLAALLGELKAAGKTVLVINGNHDINNPGAVRYLGRRSEPVKSITPEEFREIYADFGYAAAMDADPHSLSYLAEPLPGLCVIAMDSCRYRPRASVGGALAAPTLDWIAGQVSAARQQGKLVLGLMHHGLLEHFPGQSRFFPEYVIENADPAAARLAASGLAAVFTGHFHAQDIVQKQLGGKVIYDIQTGSLVTYPVPWRLVQITPDRRLVITSRTVQPADWSGSGRDFSTYARDYLVKGLRDLIPRLLTGYLVQQGVKKKKAARLTRTVLAQPLVGNLTVCDVLIAAIVRHYQGDETLSVDLLPSIQQLAASPQPGPQLIGRLLLSLSLDPAPADNHAELQL